VLTAGKMVGIHELLIVITSNPGLVIIQNSLKDHFNPYAIHIIVQRPEWKMGRGIQNFRTWRGRSVGGAYTCVREIGEYILGK
jgi:hypothetical protein